MPPLDDVFRCDQYGILTHRDCLQRQSAPGPVAPRSRGGALRLLPPQGPCGESCEQGQRIRALQFGRTVPWLRIVSRRDVGSEGKVLRIERRPLVALRVVRED